jgi:hypothetical protein
MAIGELDGSAGQEIALISQGQGVYILDWDFSENTYRYQKVIKQYESWETSGYWGLDYYADRVISANNVTYHDPANLTLHASEPIEYVWNGVIFLPDTSVYPYNTAMAGKSDANYTTFDAALPGVTNATAIIDFGQDEVGTGGVNSDYDILIDFSAALGTPLYSKFNLSISQDGSYFTQIANTSMEINGDYLEVDVDEVLSTQQWNWFRYIKISVFNGGNYSIDSLKLVNIYNTLTDALSLTIGPLRMNGTAYVNSQPDSNKILIGTVGGKFYGVGYNRTSTKYELLWDSGRDDNYNKGTGIWDITYLNTQSKYPVWNKYSSFSVLLNTPNYNSWSYVELDPFGFYDAGANYLVGTNMGEIFAYNMIGQPDLDIYGYLSEINLYLTENGWTHCSVEQTSFKEVPYLPFLAVSAFDPSKAPMGSITSNRSAEIMFYFRNNLNIPFNVRTPLEWMDLTGELVSLVSISVTTPKLDFADIDDDGDEDFAFTNGQLYLARNQFDVTGNLNFSLDRNYFKAINDEVSGYGWGQPELWDMDQDGDLDIVLNYATKNGVTAFINKGTADNPVWVQEKRLFSNIRPQTNFNYMNHTDLRIKENNDGDSLDLYSDLNNFDIMSNFSLIGFNTYDHKLYWYGANYNAIDSYLVATYPELTQTDFCLIDLSSSKFKNYGYRVYDSWSNNDELDGWTLTIGSGDLDGDGKGELIVGDYDNNVYVFENMVNNTYKRMYQTFDLCHNETTDESPYYHEELEGISGTFMRTIWDHATQLVCDVDLDQDGLKEMLVAADLQVYIFEEVGLFGGDRMQYVYSVNLREHLYVDEPGWDQVTEISALQAGNDLDYDGRRELIIAAGPFLHVFNVDRNSFEGLEHNDIFVTDPAVNGRYNLIGNPLASTAYQYARINALALGDTDKDGFREIILGGTLDTRSTFADGFVFIYEIQGGIFSKVWQLPANHSRWNPINIIKIDDQDYDGALEIIIGHANGVDIWEVVPGQDSSYVEAEYITSNANFPWLNTTQYANYRVVHNVQSDLFYFEGGGGAVYKIYTNRSTNFLRQLYWQGMLVSNQLWTAPGLLFPSVNYLTHGQATPKIVDEYEPSWVYGTTTLGVAFMASGEGVPTQGWVSYGSFPLNTPINFTSPVDGYKAHTPSIFEMNATHWGIVYAWGEDDTSQPRILRLTTIDKTLSGSFFTRDITFDGYANYWVHSCSVVKKGDGTFTLAFSASNKVSGKPDLDIYVLNLNPAFNYTGIKPIQVTKSYGNEISPNVDYLRTPLNNPIIAYENAGETFEKRIGVVGSRDGGYAWSQESSLNSIAPGITYSENINGYLDWQYQGITLTAPTAMSPAICGYANEALFYQYTWSATNFNATALGYNGFGVYGIQNDTDWIYNNLKNVVALDVGDTDYDSRREIIVGWDQYAATYELQHSLDARNRMDYAEVWLSNSFPTAITAITVYDTNGNRWEEIGIACERGNVYLLEYRDPSVGFTPLSSAKEIYMKSQNDGARLQHFEAYDIDHNGYDEIIAGGADYGIIYCLDPDGSKRWEFLEINASASAVMQLALVDITHDGLPEIVATDGSGNIYLINITNGNKIDKFAVGGPGNIMYCFTAADLTGDGIPEIIGGMNNGSIIVLNAAGQQLNQIPSVDASPIRTIMVGNFTGGNALQIAFSTFGKIIRIYYPMNGTPVYQSVPNLIGNVAPHLTAYDFNADGSEDLVFGDQHLIILDVVTDTVLANFSNLGEIYFNVHVADFDRDGHPEIVVPTKTNGVYLLDYFTLQVQWRYFLSGTTVWDLTLGNLGGQGLWDIGIATNKGQIIALDGKTGMPLWFKVYNTDLIDGIVAGNIVWQGYDELIAWDTTQRKYIGVATDILPVNATPNYEAHLIKANLALTQNLIIDYWLEDLTQDGFDEILYLTASPYYLVAYDRKLSTQLWACPLGSPILKLDVGNANSAGNRDIVILDSNKALAIINGDSGSIIRTLSIEPGFEVMDFVFDSFSGKVEHAADEICVLMVRASPYRGSVMWYNNSGQKLYQSSVNVTDANLIMAVGNFRGAPTLDVVIAGNDGDLRIFNGEDGSLWGSDTAGTSRVLQMEVGNLNGDPQSDLIFSRLNGDLVHWKMGMSPVTMKAFTNLKNFKVANVDSAPTFDETIVLLDGEGLRIYDTSGTNIWNYSAPIIALASHNLLGTIDFNNDGLFEIVLTNMQYVNVINGTTRKLLWHHVGTTNITSLKAGTFADFSEQTLSYLGDNLINIVAFSQPIRLDSMLIDNSSPIPKSNYGMIGYIFFGVSALGGIGLYIKKGRWIHRTR